MFEYISKKEYKLKSKELHLIMTELHHKIWEKYKITFDHYLIGSAKSNLVMRNGNEPFDFDYCIELKKIKREYDIKKIRNIFLEEIISISKQYGFDSFSQRQRSIKIKKHFNENRIDFYVEFAILKVINKEINILKWQNHDKYIWNQELNLNDLWRRFCLIRKKKNNWQLFKTKYKNKKNENLSNRIGKKSISVFAEVINEFETIEKC